MLTNTQLFEGNLRGARHSLPISQSISMMSLRDPPDLPPLPTPPRERGKYTGLAGPLQLAPDGTTGHNRGFSEASASSFIQQLAAARNARQQQQRSVSALASHTAVQNSLLRSSKSQETMRENRVRTWVYGTAQDTSLASPAQSEPPSQERGSIRRSPSTTNDLRTQMNDLKGKISNLQQRVKDERLKRQSFSSVRTSSPFNDVESSYYGRYHSGASATSLGAARHKYGVNGARSNGVHSANGDVRYGTAASNYEESHYESADEKFEGAKHESPDPQTMMGKAFPDYEEDSPYESTDDESIYESVIDETPSQQVERHEDRPDAFDYEHFILHSAMGSYSRDRRDSTSSSGSNESVETTKPASPLRRAMNASEDQDSTEDDNENEVEVTSPPGHKRNGSMESISTLATFMTAEENTDDPDLEVDEDGMSPLDRALPPLPSSSPQLLSDSTQQTYLGLPTNSSMRDSGVALLSPTTGRGGSADTHPLLSPLSSAPLTPSTDSDSSGTHESVLLLSPTAVSIAGSPISLHNQDQELVAALGKSLERACLALQNTDRAEYDSKIWRRRLDEARRVLEGLPE